MLQLIRMNNPLRNDIEIVEKIDGYYIVKYKNNDGRNGIVYVPDLFKNYLKTDIHDEEAISVVRSYLRGRDIRAQVI